MSEKERIIKSARELAHADVGTELWSTSLKSQVLSAADTEIGFFVVAASVLQDARNERLEELSGLYREAQKAFKANNYKEAQRIFQSLGDYSDAKHKAEIAASKERDRIAKENEQRKRNEADYEKASNLEKQKKYDQAIAAFSKLGSFKDSQKRANDLRGKEKRYRAAKSKFDQGKYSEAEREFASLGDYRNSKKLSKEAKRIRTRDKRRQRAAEINEELTKLRVEERNLVEKKNRRDEAKRIVEQPAEKEPGCLAIFLMGIPALLSVEWIILILWTANALSKNETLASNHWLLFIACTIFGPVIFISYMVWESNKVKKRKEAEQYLKDLRRQNDNVDQKLSRVRSKIEQYEKELSTLGKDALQ